MNNFLEFPPELNPSIFRAYDIRGVFAETLTLEASYWIGRAVSSESIASLEFHIFVGSDGRTSSPQIKRFLIKGLLESGCDVTDLGCIPTPVLYFATHIYNNRSGIMVTGSHNPSSYNGFKIVIAGRYLASYEIQSLYRRLKNRNILKGKGVLRRSAILDLYTNAVLQRIRLSRRLKVVIDCGNGVTGLVAPRLIKSLDCNTVNLFSIVDGNFPNHHPDPSKKENLVYLIKRVKEEKADIGIAFDGDGDRIGIVTNKGNIIYPDRLMMLFSKEILKDNLEAKIILDIKCTPNLESVIRTYGGVPIISASGHSLIKKKMKKTNSLLAGELSGHIFFRDRWFGFDDAIYTAARLLEILSLEERTSEEVFKDFPNDYTTPEISIPVKEDDKFRIIASLKKYNWGRPQKITLIDGVRVEYPHCWGLIRASNTTPSITLRFEGKTEFHLEKVKKIFRDYLRVLRPKLILDF